MIVNTKFNPNRRNLNIAVVGGGIAGMSAAWLLNKRHQIKEQDQFLLVELVFVYQVVEVAEAKQKYAEVNDCFH